MCVTHLEYYNKLWNTIYNKRTNTEKERARQKKDKQKKRKQRRGERDKKEKKTEKESKKKEKKVDGERKNIFALSADVKEEKMC